MRKLMLLTLVAVFALSAGAAWGTATVDDGWAGPDPGGYEPGLIGDYQANWAVAGAGSSSWAGWWDADDGDWVPTVGGDDGLEVTAYVELYASQEQENEAIFHWGLPPFGAQSVALNGTIVSNHPCWVGIRKDGWVEADETTKGSNLVFQKDFWDRTGPVTSPVVSGASDLSDTTADIPITFDMDVAGGGYYPMNWSGGVAAANWGWYSDGRLPAGTVNYSFKITATPDAYQADGKYELDPQVVVVPDL